MTIPCEPGLAKCHCISFLQVSADNCWR